MKYLVELLTKDEYPDLECFLIGLNDSLLYHSSYYKLFLERFLQEKSYYFVVKQQNKIIALLPSFMKQNNRYGSVLNSLPFYGSNGGVLTNKSGDQEIYELMINYFYQFAQDNNCISATIITSPLELHPELYENSISYDFKDQRIGQLTVLPDRSEDLMDIYHTKTRNTVRKSLKTIKSIEWENGLDYLDFISETHKENLKAIGGAYKPDKFFQELVRSFEYGKQLRIYIAFNEDNNPISGLLNLYYNNTIEYFTPVTVAAYRELQPLSGIIYQAMKDGVEAGLKNWNWGGTWLSQGGVYQFKSRWGTKDSNYYYYTKIWDKKILGLSKETLLKEYPYFFVVPFSALSN